MDLVRTILLELEKSERLGHLVDVQVEGRTAEEVSYHIMIMAEAGLIEARDRSALRQVRWQPTRLT
jgi:hypothetical protein